jgi:hypothetical protein
MWVRLSGLARAEGLVSFAEVAAGFHNGVAFAWLLRFADENQFKQIAGFVVERHRAGPLLMLVKAGFDIARSPGLAFHLAGDDARRAESGCGLSRGDYSWSAVLKATPPARLPAWLYAFWHSDRRTRAALLDSAPASRDFVKFLTRIVHAHGEAARATAIAQTVDHVIAHGGGAWKVLLKQIGVRWWNSPAEARALVASGVPLAEMQIGDALAIATWVYPERVQGMLQAHGYHSRRDPISR